MMTTIPRLRPAKPDTSTLIIYGGFIIPSVGWSVSVEGGPNGEATVFYGGVAVANVPESSTWAMMLLGFAGLGFAGYRAARKGVSLAA